MLAVLLVQAFQDLAQDQDKCVSPLPPLPLQVLDKFLSISNLQEALLEEVEYSLHPKPRVRTWIKKSQMMGIYS